MEQIKPVKIAMMSFENGHCFFLYQALLRQPMVEVVAVSFAPRQRIIYEKRLSKEIFDGVDIFYDDEEMLKAHPEIEACVLGGANCRHMAQFRMCATRGIHVISMKAPTYDMAEYDEMIRLQEENNIRVFVELEMRWKASTERIKEIINSGQLGEINSFSAYNYSHNPMWWQHWMDIPEESYGKRIPIRPGSRNFRGGCLTDHPHIFDLVRYILDSDFDTIYAEAAPNMRDGAETEDMVYVIAKMKNGVTVSLDPSYANREPEQARLKNLTFLSEYPRPVQVELQINGSKGSILSDPYGADYSECLTPEMRYRVSGGGYAIDSQRPIFIGNFVRNIRLGDAYNPPVSLREHKKTIQAMNAAYESIYTGKVVKVQYDD